jgi:hypothetical protein
MEAPLVGGNLVIVGLLQEPSFTLEILPFILKQFPFGFQERDHFGVPALVAGCNTIRPAVSKIGDLIVDPFFEASLA